MANIIYPSRSKKSYVKLGDPTH